MDGFQGSEFMKEMSGISTFPSFVEEWIKYQRDSLARISAQQEEAKGYQERKVDSLQKCGVQLTLFGQVLYSWKTPQISGQEDGQKSSGSSWREDIPGETERLQPLMLELPISGNGGGSSLPTLTVCGNWNISGSSKDSADGIATAMRRLPTLTAQNYGSNQGGAAGRVGKKRVSVDGWLKTLPTLTASDGTGGPGTSSKRTGGMNLRTKLPTLCATDYKSPYSQAGYERQTEKRSKPLLDTLVHSTGHRLTPAFAEWYMGFPIGYTAIKVLASKLSETRRSR